MSPTHFDFCVRTKKYFPRHAKFFSSPRRQEWGLDSKRKTQKKSDKKNRTCFTTSPTNLLKTKLTTKKTNSCVYLFIMKILL